MLQQAIIKMLETNDKIECFSKRIESLNKELEDIKEDQMGILEFKYIIT